MLDFSEITLKMSSLALPFPDTASHYCKYDSEICALGEQTVEQDNLGNEAVYPPLVKQCYQIFCDYFSLPYFILNEITKNNI